MTSMRDGKIVGRKLLVERFKRVVEETIELDNGERLDWIYLDSPKSIVIVALTPEREVVVMNIYRHNIRRSAIELPAGGAEKGESDQAAAARELLEETGYAAEETVGLGTYYVMPTETNRHVSYFLALDAKKVQEPVLDNLIEKYWEMSVEVIPLEELRTTKGAADHGLNGMEALFGVQLALEYLKEEA